MPFSKILIPVDFSERCLGAARFSIPLAERFHSEITFLHVQEPLTAESDVKAERQERIEKQLRDFLCAAFAHLDVKRVLRRGDPASEIVAYANNHDSDLIMMPTHGYGAFRRLLLGSITSKVLHDSVCPVWTGTHLAQGPPAEWINPTLILCAVEDDAQSKKTLVWASLLASELDAALLLVHVAHRFDSPGEGFYSREFHQHVLAEANRKMDELQRIAGTRAELIIESGSLVSTVSKVAEERKADLLVIGRGGNPDSGMLSLNSYGIIRESP